MNILIFEDEIPAYQKLFAMVQNEIDDAQVVGWARSVQEAVLLLQNQTPDLIISDIQLLDGASFEIFENTEVQCPIVFCTAYDQFLLRAFQTNGIAYILKPYSVENFREAIEKYHTLFGQKQDAAIAPEVAKELRSVLFQDQKNYKKRFAIKKKDGIKLLETKDIAYFEAHGDFCVAFDEKGLKHALNMTLSEAEAKLDPSRFFRLNRSQIVHIAFIEKVEAYSKSKLAVRLLGIKNYLMTSGSRTAEFRSWLDG